MTRWFSLVLLLAGCPSALEAPVSATCAKAGDKCKTPSGPLGVCDSARCGEGESAPCFRCVPQH